MNQHNHLLIKIMLPSEVESESSSQYLTEEVIVVLNLMNCCIYKCHNVSLLREHMGTLMAKGVSGSVKVTTKILVSLRRTTHFIK